VEIVGGIGIEVLADVTAFAAQLTTELDAALAKVKINTAGLTAQLSEGVEKGAAAGSAALAGFAERADATFASVSAAAAKMSESMAASTASGAAAAEASLAGVGASAAVAGEEMAAGAAGGAALGAGVASGAARAQTSMAALGASVAKGGKVAAVILAATGAASTYMAGNFQTAMTRIETGAAEAHSNIAADSAGVLREMAAVGAGSKALTSGLYLINSAGFHAAEGLNILHVGAQGAKVGAADLTITTNALTTALTAWHLGAGNATAAMNTLIAAESRGKTNLEALASALPTVGLVASQAGVSLTETAAALSTMTAQGLDARVAATYLRQTIGQLSAPTVKARKEMEALGIDATAVSQTLGKKGLAAALTVLTDAIQAKMGPAGLVILDSLRKASGSAEDFQEALNNVPPQAQTYIGALATMAGGVKGMQAALALSGPNMATFQENITAIGDKVKEGGDKVEGWDAVQGNFNQKMSEMKGTVEALGIKIGNDLLPRATSMANTIKESVGWFEKHNTTAKALTDTIIALSAACAAYAVVAKVVVAVKKAMTIADGIEAAAKGIATAAQWVYNLALWACPITWIVAAVLVLIGVIVLIATKTTWFQTAWSATWGFIKGVGLAIGGWFAGPFTNFFVSAWGKITGAFNAVWGFIKGIGAWFAGPFANFFVNAWNKIVAAWNGALAWFRALPGRLLAGLAALPGLLWSLFTGALTRVAYAIGFGIGFIIGFWIKLPGRIINAISALGTMLWNWMVAAWSYLSTAVVSGVNAVIAWFVALPGRIVSAVVNLGNLLMAWMTNAWVVVSQAVVSGVNAVIAWFVALPGRIVSAVSSLASMLAGWASSAWSTCYNAVVSAGSRVIDWFAALPGKLWGFLSGLPGKIAALGSDIINGLANAISGAAGRLWDLAKNMAGSFLKGFKDALGISSPSKVFYRVVYEDVGDGIGLAMTDLQEPVARQAGQLARTGMAQPAIRSVAYTLADAAAAMRPAAMQLQSTVTSQSAYQITNIGGVPTVPISTGSRSSSDAGQSRASVTYQINVTALDPRAAAPLVISAIKEFERSNGNSWRTTA
jgi:TP901 family phage tail tape measure protein